jgi:hypothetical protein
MTYIVIKLDLVLVTKHSFVLAHCRLDMNLLNVYPCELYRMLHGNTLSLSP